MGITWTLSHHMVGSSAIHSLTAHPTRCLGGLWARPIKHTYMLADDSPAFAIDAASDVCKMNLSVAV